MGIVYWASTNSSKYFVFSILDTEFVDMPLLKQGRDKQEVEERFRVLVVRCH